MCEPEHNLETICTTTKDDLSEVVVRWCKDCGGVVIDIDYDNRTIPGGVLPMQFPSIIQKYNDAVKWIKLAFDIKKRKKDEQHHQNK